MLHVNEYIWLSLKVTQGH